MTHRSYFLLVFQSRKKDGHGSPRLESKGPIASCSNVKHFGPIKEHKNERLVACFDKLPARNERRRNRDFYGGSSFSVMHIRPV
jgi:hypothetical protein